MLSVREVGWSGEKVRLFGYDTVTDLLYPIVELGEGCPRMEAGSL